MHAQYVRASPKELMKNDCFGRVVLCCFAFLLFVVVVALPFSASLWLIVHAQPKELNNVLAGRVYLSANKYYLAANLIFEFERTLEEALHTTEQLTNWERASTYTYASYYTGTGAAHGFALTQGSSRARLYKAFHNSQVQGEPKSLTCLRLGRFGFQSYGGLTQPFVHLIAKSWLGPQLIPTPNGSSASIVR